MPDTTPLPRWDMTPIFLALDAPEFATEFDAAVAEITALAQLFDELEVRRQEHTAQDFATRYETVTQRLNTLRDRLRTLGSYISCFVTTDARNDTAKARQSQLETQ